MGIYNIFPNAFLLDNPTNIVLPHDLRAYMEHRSWFVRVEIIIETFSNGHNHGQHGRIILIVDMAHQLLTL